MLGAEAAVLPTLDAVSKPEVNKKDVHNPSEALHEEDGGWWAVDDVTGEQLDPVRVKAARREELAYFRSMGVYEKVPIEEAAAAGQRPIAVRWIDINKGDKDEPNYRSRLVAK